MIIVHNSRVISIKRCTKKSVLLILCCIFDVMYMHLSNVFLACSSVQRGSRLFSSDRALMRPSFGFFIFLFLAHKRMGGFAVPHQPTPALARRPLLSAQSKHVEPFAADFAERTFLYISPRFLIPAQQYE